MDIQQDKCIYGSYKINFSTTAIFSNDLQELIENSEEN
jgi:hypothetical protein